MKTQTDIRSFYEFQPLVSLDHAWQIGFVIGLLIALASVTIWIHHRSVRKASWSLGLLLNATRLTMLGLLCLFFLNPVKRTETRFEKPSRLVFLVDTSLSMGLVDPLDPNRRSQDESRISKVKNWLTQTDAIRQLIEHHELEFFQFGGSDSIQSVAIFPKANSIATQSLRPSDPMQQDLLKRYGQWIGIGKATIVFGGLAIITILCAIALGLFRPADRVIVRLYQVGIPGILLTVLLVAIVDLNTSELNWLTSVGLTTFPENLALAESAESPEQENSAEDLDRNKFKWVESLISKGTTTPIGSALQQIINRERGGAIAGIILISDGNSNSGLRIEQATAEAANAGIRLYPVGIGSRMPLPNLSVTDFQAPPKTYPGDPFQLKAIIKNLNMQTADITVQLFSQSTTDDSKEILEDEQTVKVNEVSSDLTTVKFSVTPERVGKIRYTIRVRPLPSESNRNDNQLSSSVEVIERRTKILIIAGGPTREFRFLRNQFFRDPEIESHVWLQSAKQGVDQESDQLLDQFPAKQDDMFQYDCLIAFDPDWRMLTPDQSQLLENWIAEQAGGMLVVAGPVNTPEWTRQPRGTPGIDLIRKLYPVSFYSQGTAQLKLGRFGGREAFPIGFSRVGRTSEYLKIAESEVDSRNQWDSFAGVYGYYAVNESKPGAEILSRFTDPETSVAGQLPIYMASHFYGSGRVFFQASGEMWRIRRIDVSLFEQYYIRLTRWLAQGRLFRQSSKGILLSDREQCWVGDSFSLTAILKNSQNQPLEIPEVPATLFAPNGLSQQIVMKKEPNSVRRGTYSTSIVASFEGEYRVRLPLPLDQNFETLTTSVRAKIPDLEKEQTERNEELLRQIADKTEGHYFEELENFLANSDKNATPLSIIQPQDQESFLVGVSDPVFQRKWMIWLMILITGLFSLEWLLRRINRLA